jgi:hypothetical protein
MAVQVNISFKPVGESREEGGPHASVCGCYRLSVDTAGGTEVSSAPQGLPKPACCAVGVVQNLCCACCVVPQGEGQSVEMLTKRLQLTVDLDLQRGAYPKG